MKIMRAIIIITAISIEAYAYPSTPIHLEIAPSSDTILLGDTLMINATIYDNLNEPLKQYTTDTIYDTCFSWKFTTGKYTPSNVLFLDSIGSSISIVPPYFFTFYIICTFNLNSSYCNDTISIYIKYPIRYKLYIESDYHWENSPNQPNPINDINIVNKSDTVHLYAVKRDQFGNYISPASNALWSSSSPIIEIQNGIDSIGEALIYLDSNVVVGNCDIWCNAFDTLYDTTRANIFILSETINPRINISNNSSTSNHTYNAFGQRIMHVKSNGLYFMVDDKNKMHVRINTERTP